MPPSKSTPLQLTLTSLSTNDFTIKVCAWWIFCLVLKHARFSTVSPFLPPLYLCLSLSFCHCLSVSLFLSACLHIYIFHVGTCICIYIHLWISKIPFKRVLNLMIQLNWLVRMAPRILLILPPQCCWDYRKYENPICYMYAGVWTQGCALLKAINHSDIPCLN